MAYSGTQTFNLSIEEIIEEALERCQLESRSGYDLKTAKRSLNLMFAEWANRGLNLWTITYETQTLTAGTNYYSIDQKVVDIIDAVVTTTTGATSNLEGDSSTTDVAMSRISRTEYINLSKKENFAASTLLNFKNLAPVMVIPLLDVPGISAKTWYRPMTNASLLEIDNVSFFSSLFLSLIKSRTPKKIVA